MALGVEPRKSARAGGSIAGQFLQSRVVIVRIAKALPAGPVGVFSFDRSSHPNPRFPENP
jgi:hypothetical protein